MAAGHGQQRPGQTYGANQPVVRDSESGADGQNLGQEAPRELRAPRAWREPAGRRDLQSVEDGEGLLPAVAGGSRVPACIEGIAEVGQRLRLVGLIPHLPVELVEETVNKRAFARVPARLAAPSW
jgi:hypothetical protein